MWSSDNRQKEMGFQILIKAYFHENRKAIAHAASVLLPE